MARKIKLNTPEMGELEMLLIREQNGQWEPEWEPLRGTIFGDQFSIISKEIVHEGLKRWTKPLVDALGILPSGALKKIPVESRACFMRTRCPLYDSKNCFPEAKNMPWCFEPDGVADPLVRHTATRAFEYWRERVYLVVVREEPNAAGR